MGSSKAGVGKAAVIPDAQSGKLESRDSPMCNCTSEFDAEPVGPRVRADRGIARE
jgi:hypothetical protein